MKVKIIQNPDKELCAMIKQGLKDNEGFCPCKVVHNPDNKCICKEFREQELGHCHCGLFIKVEEKENASKGEINR